MTTTEKKFGLCTTVNVMNPSGNNSTDEVIDLLEKLKTGIETIGDEEKRSKLRDQVEDLGKMTGQDRAKVLAYRAVDDLSLPHFAAINRHCPDYVVSTLVKTFQSFLDVKRKSPYEGQSVLHSLVSLRKVRLVREILENMENGDRQKRLNEHCVTKVEINPTRNTCMLGGLPLSIAALTLNLDMVDVLLEQGAKLYLTNDRKETVFHSLVRFSACNSEQEQVLKMMTELHKRLCKKYEPKSVWFIPNEDGNTALQLAALLVQHSLFSYIVSLSGVYCDLDKQYGLFDHFLHDITEIDPAALKELEIDRIQKIKARQEQSPEGMSEKADKFQGYTYETNEKRLSVLEIIDTAENVTPENRQAIFEILNNRVVKRVFEKKWKAFKWIYRGWFIFHVALMITLTAYAICRSKVMSNKHTEADKMFSIFGAAVGCSVSAVVILPSIWKTLRWFVMKVIKFVKHHCLEQVIKYQSPGHIQFHRRLWYKGQCYVFFLALFADTMVYFACLGDSDQCSTAISQPLSALMLLSGWSFCVFFLRPWKIFSFFTIMLLEVFVCDMFRFACVVIPVVLSFWIAMHITFLPAQSVPGEFENEGTTSLTMFKLMLGLSELKALNSAPPHLQWLATSLFIGYVVLVYLIMFNALIALMANTCSIASENRDNHWRRERLSVVMHLQRIVSSLYQCCHHRSITGDRKDFARYDFSLNQFEKDGRWVMDIPILNDKGMEDDGYLDLIVSKTFQDRQGKLVETMGQSGGDFNMYTNIRNLLQTEMKRSHPPLDNNTDDKRSPTKRRKNKRKTTFRAVSPEVCTVPGSTDQFPSPQPDDQQPSTSSRIREDSPSQPPSARRSGYGW